MPHWRRGKMADEDLMGGDDYVRGVEKLVPP